MKKALSLLSVLLFAALAVGLIATTAAAQVAPPPPTDNDVNRVAKQLYCPVCENIPLDVCPTQACAQWRDLIREKLSLGWSERQIKDYFVAQYGDRVLATPPLSNWFNWLLLAGIGLSVLAGGFILYRVLSGMRHAAVEPESAHPVTVTGPDADYLRRMEDELKKRE